MFLGIPYYDNIIPVSREIENKQVQDFRLTRFACYLTVMNGDPKKIEVAKAQVYFARQTRKFELYLENNNEIDRLLIREELAEGNKSLSSIIQQAGVTDYAKFTNAGYLGMYNMENWKLANKRKVIKKKLMDTMGRTELAANLFRITQTEERIKNKGVKGQTALERTHHQVGNEVRKMVIKNVGTPPENLIQEKELSNVKKDLKDGYKKMLKEDNENNKKKK